LQLQKDLLESSLNELSCATKVVMENKKLQVGFEGIRWIICQRSHC